MATWYEVWASFNSIKAVEVERETESSVFINGRRKAKRSDFYNYFPSWEEAHQLLVDEATKDVEQLRLRLERANGRLGNVKGMKPPAP